MATRESDVLLLTLTVWAFLTGVSTTPAADFCCKVRVNCFALSHESETCNRSPEISSIAFHAQPSDLPPASLMNMGFVVIGRFARHRRPRIRFLFIGSRVCSKLPSDPASPRRLCASLSLHLHQVVKRTCTSKLSFMLGVPKKGPRHRPRPLVHLNLLFAATLSRKPLGVTLPSWAGRYRSVRICSCPLGLRPQGKE